MQANIADAFPLFRVAIRTIPMIKQQKLKSIPYPAAEEELYHPITINDRINTITDSGMLKIPMVVLQPFTMVSSVSIF